MKMSSSGFAPRRRQGGFIQGAILFALVIIAVVVAAFSLANRDSQSSADSEQARVNASFVLKVGNDLQTGVNRAIADGFNPANLVSNLALNGTASSGATLNLFDPTLKYMVRPQFPTTALIAAGTQPFADSTTANGAALQTVSITGVGGGDQDAVITVKGLKEDVCKRINVTANGVLVSAGLPTGINSGDSAGWREGCYNGGTTNGGVYFRVIATDVAAATTGGTGGGTGGGT
jgi:hypothetical protein